MSTIADRLAVALRGKNLAAIESAKSFGPDFVETCLGRGFIEEVLPRRSPTFFELRKLAAGAGVSFMWIIDDFADRADDIPTLEDDVRFRLMAILFGIKVGDRSPYFEMSEPLRLNPIERLAVGRLVHRYMGVSMAPDVEDSAKTIGEYIKHIALCLKHHLNQEFECIYEDSDFGEWSGL